MTRTRKRLGVIGVLLVASGLALGWWLTRPSPAVTHLYSFRGGPDAFKPWQLTLGSDGALYGATWGWPAIFRLTPNGVFLVLARLRDAIGSGLVEGDDGYLYALAIPGDALALCRFTRDGAVSVLHSFGTPQGPAPGLLVGRDGHVYGLSVGDGTNKKGTFYRVIPGGDFSILHHFGPEEYAGSHLIQHSDGAFYGVAPGGPFGLGTVFRVTSEGDYRVVHAFTEADGLRDPVGRLTEGNRGDLFGVAKSGDRRQSQTTVFRVSTNGSLSALHTFRPGAWVEELVRGSDGAFYGTGSAGSRYTSRIGQWIESLPGRIRRPEGGALWRVSESGEATLVCRIPAQSVLVGDDGVYYGVAPGGGAHNRGLIYRLDVPR